tara:strand:- start:8929 stop:10353 length:1425 start_codon:yes stop_codon:yes gene_type:complete
MTPVKSTDMAEKRSPWNLFGLIAKEETRNPMIEKAREGIVTEDFRAVAGIPDIVRDTERLRKDSNHDNEYDLYDNMLKLDPELNGAVRAVSLTANNYEINYSKGRNARIRDAIRSLVEDTIEFDDIMINAMRNLMVYGNDINKIVGRQGVGITKVQSLPIKQITIVDERGGAGSYFVADYDNPIINPEIYMVREGSSYERAIPASEILHIKIDARSNWFTDNKLRKTYGIWGASRFTSLKQPIRMKYNSMNNRISLEDSMTKQFITIDKSAIEHIQDPAEQNERLTHIMNEVIKLFEGLRGDQIPVLPHYVQLHHVDVGNSVPNNTGFLDTINADIAAVLQVPRVAAGQERGSTFAATYNANLWAVQAISRMHRILSEAATKMFMLHLDLLGIEYRKQDLPTIKFEAMDSETPLNVMQRVVLGYNSGILTLNQALDMLSLPSVSNVGDQRKGGEGASVGELPRENSQPGAVDYR